jgi:hypothetical protein
MLYSGNDKIIHYNGTEIVEESFSAYLAAKPEVRRVSVTRLHGSF